MYVFMSLPDTKRTIPDYDNERFPDNELHVICSEFFLSTEQESI